jgi:predicted transposase/invertase (TIGR01784 family)
MKNNKEIEANEDIEILQKAEEIEQILKVPKRKYKEYKKNEYSIRNHTIFKMVFGNNERVHLLKSFLEAILEKKITNIVVRNEVTLDKLFVDNKESRLDLLAEIDNKEKINIELQHANEYNVISRGLHYGSGLYYESLKESQKYTESYKTVVIWILGYNLFEDGPYHEKGIIKRESNGETLTEEMVYHYIQLPKFWEEVKEIKTKKEQWISYISGQLNKEEVGVLSKMNDDIEETERIIKRVMEDEDLRYEIMRREFDAYDKWDRENYAKKQGIEEGKIEIAKKMIADNKDIQEIIKYTELSEDEVKKLIDEK